MGFAEATLVFITSMGYGNGDGWEAVSVIMALVQREED